MAGFLKPRCALTMPAAFAGVTLDRSHIRKPRGQTWPVRFASFRGAYSQ